MVNDPSQGRLYQCQVVLLDNRLNDFECLLKRRTEISITIQLTGGCIVAKPPFRWSIVKCAVFAAEKATSKRVVYDDICTSFVSFWHRGRDQDG